MQSQNTSISTGAFRSSRCERRTETSVFRRSWLFLPPQPARLSISLAHHVASSRCGPRSPRVRGTDPEKSRFFQESFILPRRTVEVKTDRTACRDFLGGNHSANHQSVAEHHPAAWLQYAKHFGQHAESSGNMAQNVIREHGVKGRFVEGKILGSVTLLEMCLGSKPRRLCKLLRIANSGFIDVQPYDLAAQLFCKMQSISPGTATDLQYGGIAAQTKQLGNFQ